MEYRIEVKENGFWLPIKALVRGKRGLWSCYVAEPDSDSPQRSLVVRRDVEILHNESDSVYVRGTLSDGDQVIIDGIHRVTAGQLVTSMNDR
jgi:hypothetical protein